MFQEFLENQNLLIGALIPASIILALVISLSIVKFIEVREKQRKKK